MTHVLITNTGPVELRQNEPFETNGLQYAANTVVLWTAEELAQIGVFPLVDDPIPAGKVAASSSISFDGHLARRVHVLVDAPPTPVVVPASVTPAQAKLALYQAGKLADVEAAVAAHPYEPVRIYFNNALQWERDNPYIMGLAQQLSWTETQVDALFIAASKIV